MALHRLRQEAIRRSLDEGHRPAVVAADLGVAPSTLRGWLRWARMERQLAELRELHDAQALRQRRIEQELASAAAQLELLRQRLDREDHRDEG
jgi:transposase-like protein